jgi:hypothetical protein
MKYSTGPSFVILMKTTFGGRSELKKLKSECMIRSGSGADDRSIIQPDD